MSAQYPISRYALMNSLKLNPSKTQVIIFSKTKLKISSLPQVVLDSISLPYLQTVKNLGVLLHFDLSWEPHINYLCQKVYGALHSLRKLSNFTPPSLKLTLFKSLVYPLLTYGDLLFALSIDSSCTRKINVAFNNCARYVFDLKPRGHTSEHSPKLLGHNIITVLKVRCLKLIYKILNSTVPFSPPYLTSYFEFGPSQRLRTVRLIRATCNKFKNSFRVAGGKLWNSLPLGVRALGTLDSFVTGATNHLEPKLLP